MNTSTAAAKLVVGTIFGLIGLSLLKHSAVQFVEVANSVLNSK